MSGHPITVVAAGNGDALEPDYEHKLEHDDAPPGSVLAHLRQRARVERRDATLDVALGGVWEGGLIVRYGMPSQRDADRLTAAAARFADPTSPSVGSSALAVDVMATCCRTMLGSDGGVPVDLGVRLDGKLVRLLELPLPPGVDDPDDVSASELVQVLFEDNWLAVQAHAARVMTWLQRGVDTPGEASAT